MAQTRTGYSKVAAPRHLGANISSHSTEITKFAMICMVMLMIVSVFHVWSRAKVLDLNLSISESAKKINEAEQESKRLSLEITALKTPSRIESIARNELGMSRPSDSQIILVK